MSTNFPTSLDILTNPTSTDKVSVVSHADQHANANDAIEALEAKVGVNGSAVTTTHDYKLSNVTDSAKAVSDTNGTLTTPKVITSINDTNNNELIKVTAASSAVNEITVENSATGADPSITASGNDTNIGLKIKAKGSGKVKLGTAELQFPNADGTSGQYLSTNGSGVLSFTSQTVAPATSFRVGRLGDNLAPSVYSDKEAYTASSSSATFGLETSGYPMQKRDATSDFASASGIMGVVILGSYIYVMLRHVGTAYRVYRYDITNLAGGGTQMTFSGQSLAFNNNNQTMTSDGTSFYFTNKAGNSANDYVVSKYSLSGTTFTYVSDITCGSTANRLNSGIIVDSSQNIYGVGSGDAALRKYNSSGTLQYTTSAFSSVNGLNNLNGTYYLAFTSAMIYEKLFL